MVGLMFRYFPVFIEEWFRGYVGIDSAFYREFGICIGDFAEKKGFVRKAFSLSQFLEYYGVRVKPFFRDANLFMGIGAWFFLEEQSEKSMVYDRLVYDFDSEDPKRSLDAAFEFSNKLWLKYDADSVVVKSGFKGAHVYVPLAKLVDWETYKQLWLSLLDLVPEQHRQMIDTNMLQYNRLIRIPFTVNYKEGKRAWAWIKKPSINGPGSFSWKSLKPLHPEKVRIALVKPSEPDIHVLRPPKLINKGRIPLPQDPADLTKLPNTPPCISAWLEELVNKGEMDHYERVALTLFLKAIGYSAEETIELFRKYAKDFKENITRYQVEYLYGKRGSGKDWKMYSCAKLNQLGLCLNCGFNRNPVSYFFSKRSSPPH
jgi:hypothetical protein